MRGKKTGAGDRVKRRYIIGDRPAKPPDVATVFSSAEQLVSLPLLPIPSASQPIRFLSHLLVPLTIHYVDKVISFVDLCER